MSLSGGIERRHLPLHVPAKALIMFTQGGLKCKQIWPFKRLPLRSRTTVQMNRKNNSMMLLDFEVMAYL